MVVRCEMVSKGGATMTYSPDAQTNKYDGCTSIGSQQTAHRQLQSLEQE